MNLILLIQENPFLNSFFRIITSFIKIVPFYVFLEYFHESNELNIKPKLDNYDIKILNPDDMEYIASSGEVPESEATLLDRLNNGCICYGITHEDHIAAYSWCNLNYLDYNVKLKFMLKHDEAYLFDARTFKKFRGKNLAPFLRSHVYTHLKTLGRTKYYSISLVGNKSAIKFKEKLKAKKYRLYVYICLFRKIHFTIPVKEYFDAGR